MHDGLYLTENNGGIYNVLVDNIVYVYNGNMFMDDTVNMIEIVIYGIIGLLMLTVAYMIIYDRIKDNEWRKNNPEEHNIMERKIKDDFSE